MANSLLYVFLALILILLSASTDTQRLLEQVRKRIQPSIEITKAPVEARRIIPQEKVTTDTTRDTGQWGEAKKIGEHTYTIKVGEDDRMATPQEVVDSLNTYRSVQGVGNLSVDSKLSEYAQTRADFFRSQGTTDAHAGFSHYLDNEDGFTKLGFYKLGENSYFGGPLYGVHLIEWVFAKSPEHNANQLSPDWSYVGVGTNGTAVNLIFGGSKM